MLPRRYFWGDMCDLEVKVSCGGRQNVRKGRLVSVPVKGQSMFIKEKYDF